MRPLVLPLVITLLVTPGCIERGVAEVDPAPNREERTQFQVEVNRNVDILFVIDDSGSMEAEQLEITENFNRMIEKLQSLEDGLPNVHIGVISTDVGAGPYLGGYCEADGENGRLQRTGRIPGCTPPADSFIKDIELADGTRDRNYTESLSETFACIAKLGIQGCGFEQPLEAMRRALNGSNPQNLPFLREDARLAVIFVSDEDDCSTREARMFSDNDGDLAELGPRTSYRCFEFGIQCESGVGIREPGVRENCVPLEGSDFMYDIEEYVGFLNSLKDRPDQEILVAGIIADLTPVETVLEEDSRYEDLVPAVRRSCDLGPSDEHGADPPIRLASFIKSFTLNRIERVCDDDLSPALEAIAQLIADGLNDACILGEIADVDDVTPGLQYDCVVEEIRPTAAGEVRSVMPICDNAASPESSSELPCYVITENITDCDHTESKLSVEVYYSDSDNRPSDTQIDARCIGA
jgi:hypothetical protein